MNQRERNKIQACVSHMSLKPVRRARAERSCSFCVKGIKAGQEFRDGGAGREAHVSCYEAIISELRIYDKGTRHGNQTDHTSAGTGATDH